MAIVEGRYRKARDLMKGNPIIGVMAAGIAAVPLGELAGADGTPRFDLMQKANRAFADAEARNAGNPAYVPYPDGAQRHIGLVAEAVLARRAEVRAAVAAFTAPPGTSPESDEVTRAVSRTGARALWAIAASPQALLLCDGCYEAATGLPAVCQDG